MNTHTQNRQAGRAKTRDISRAQFAYGKQSAKALPDCGTGSILLVDRKTKEVAIVLTRCHRWACPHCAPIRLAQAKDKARRGHPERHIVLTCRPQERWSTAYHVKWLRKKARLFIQKARREFGHFEYMMSLELHKNEAPHLHILQRGCYMSQRWISDAWFALTGNFKVWISQVKRTEAAVAELTKYLAKTAAQLAEVLPGIAVFTTSDHWLIDPPARDPSYAEHDWLAVYMPARTADVVDAAAALGCSVKPNVSCPGTFALELRDNISAQEIQQSLANVHGHAFTVAHTLLLALSDPAEYIRQHTPIFNPDDPRLDLLDPTEPSYPNAESGQPQARLTTASIL